eukprot:COSAG01_NODE_5130_length_4466_cov_23.058621_1_plen_112_part_10
MALTGAHAAATPPPNVCARNPALRRQCAAALLLWLAAAAAPRRRAAAGHWSRRCCHGPAARPGLASAGGVPAGAPRRTYLSDSQAAGLLYNVNISRVLNPNRSRNAQIESSR